MRTLQAKVKELYSYLQKRLSLLSFRVGVIVLLACLPCYALSFSLPFLVEAHWAKIAIWATFFGLAKCFHYAGLAIVGVEGWKKIKAWFRQRK